MGLGEVDLNCPICRDGSQRGLGVNPDFAPSRIVACAACGFMWTSPLPSEVELSERYRQEYRTLRKEKITGSFLAARDIRAQAQRRFILEHRPDWNSATELNVMDVGCAAGSLLSAFGSNAGLLTGYEPDEQMAAAARDRLPAGAEIHNRTLDQLSAEMRRYDLICLSHSLEHTREPVETIRRLLRLCKPGGLLFIEVPNESEATVKKLCRGGGLGLFHLIFFQRSHLERCIDSAGGASLRIGTFGDDLEQASFFGPGGGRRLRTAISRRLFRGQAAEMARLRRVMNFENPGEGKWIRCLCAPLPSR